MGAGTEAEVAGTGVVETAGIEAGIEDLDSADNRIAEAVDSEVDNTAEGVDGSKIAGAAGNRTEEVVDNKIAGAADSGVGEVLDKGLDMVLDDKELGLPLFPYSSYLPYSEHRGNPLSNGLPFGCTSNIRN